MLNANQLVLKLKFYLISISTKNKLGYHSNDNFFPQSIKHLDLSHNQIDSWFNENSSCSDQVCYAASESANETVLPILSENRKISSRLGRLTSRQGCCIHKKHVRLDGLRTLILSDNKLDRIQVCNCGFDFGIIFHGALQLPQKS